jgi:hypothetical protein
MVTAGCTLNADTSDFAGNAAAAGGACRCALFLAFCLLWADALVQQVESWSSRAASPPSTPPSFAATRPPLAAVHTCVAPHAALHACVCSFCRCTTPA